MKAVTVESLQVEIFALMEALYTSKVSDYAQESLCEIARGEAKVSDYIDGHREMLQTPEAKLFLKQFRRVRKLRRLQGELLANLKNAVA